jgi:DNA invertase Pin-like site-specific DNA recombinase
MMEVSMRRERAALYVRVSTTDKGQTTENQERELRAWAERQGLDVVAVFADHVSGAKGREARDGLKAMLEAAHRREFDVLLVWALDRLSREGIGAVHRYVDDLVRCKVKLRSLREAWLALEDGNPVTPLILAIFAWVADMERRRIAERTRAGMQRARAQGKHIGRPRLDLSSSDIVAALHQRGLSFRAAARELGVSDRQLRRYVKANPILKDLAATA